jgi:hypothetical protein
MVEDGRNWIGVFISGYCVKKMRLLLDLNKKLNQVGDYQDFL